MIAKQFGFTTFLKRVKKIGLVKNLNSCLTMSEIFVLGDKLFKKRHFSTSVEQRVKIAFESGIYSAV